MTAPRDPVDRVVDAIVALPVACATAVRQLIPIGTTRLERRIGRDLDLVMRYAKRGLPNRSAGTRDGSRVVDAVERPVAPAAATPDAPSAVATPVADATADGELAIDGYDQLSARQVIDRLIDLTPAELAAVERYEQQGRRRQTILQRIAQLT